MKTLVGGLVLIFLLLITGCAQTDEWDVWKIKCFNPEFKTWEEIRFEGKLRQYDTNSFALFPKDGGRTWLNNRQCEYTWLGKGGIIDNG